METAVKLARIGNFILSLMAVCMMILMLAYGGYSLWDNYMINSGAFLTSDLLKSKPPENSDAEDNLSLEELMALNPETRGWLTIDGKTYFMNESGAMVEGWYKVQDNWYYFYPGQGQKAVNTSISGFQLDANGVWQH